MHSEATAYICQLLCTAVSQLRSDQLILLVPYCSPTAPQLVPNELGGRFWTSNWDAMTPSLRTFASPLHVYFTVYGKLDMQLR
jgi:hypothetical protein